MKRIILYSAVLMVLLFGLGLPTKALDAAGGIPPWPVIYSGSITLGGQPVPDGMIVKGRMGTFYSAGLATKDGRMAGLAVGPPDASYYGRTINFVLEDAEGNMVEAQEEDIFAGYSTPFLKSDFNLTFPNFPTPTPLPTATPTQTPIATPTLVPTATPIVVGTVVYNGMVVASGAAVPAGASLTARMGSYESSPVPVTNGQFISLIVDLNDPDLTGGEISFYLDGIQARTTATYDVGPTIRNIDLIFMDLPVLPTSTSLPVPTTPPLPTQPVEVEEKVVNSPTVAPLPTPIPVQETPTPVILVVTATPEVPEKGAEIVQGVQDKEGSCGAVRDVDPLTGAGNVLAMIGPVLLLVAFRGYRRLF